MQAAVQRQCQTSPPDGVVRLVRGIIAPSPLPPWLRLASRTAWDEARSLRSRPVSFADAGATEVYKQESQECLNRNYQDAWFATVAFWEYYPHSGVAVGTDLPDCGSEGDRATAILKVSFCCLRHRAHRLAGPLSSKKTAQARGHQTGGKRRKASLAPHAGRTVLSFLPIESKMPRWAESTPGRHFSVIYHPPRLRARGLYKRGSRVPCPREAWACEQSGRSGPQTRRLLPF